MLLTVSAGGAQRRTSVRTSARITVHVVANMHPNDARS